MADKYLKVKFISLCDGLELLLIFFYDKLAYFNHYIEFIS